MRGKCKKGPAQCFYALQQMMHTEHSFGVLRLAWRHICLRLSEMQIDGAAAPSCCCCSPRRKGNLSSHTGLLLETEGLGGDLIYLCVTQMKECISYLGILVGDNLTLQSLFK